MKTHGEYFFAPYGERSFFMELKTVGLTKKFGSKIAVDDLNITLASVIIKIAFFQFEVVIFAVICHRRCPPLVSNAWSNTGGRG